MGNSILLSPDWAVRWVCQTARPYITFIANSDRWASVQQRIFEQSISEKVIFRDR